MYFPTLCKVNDTGVTYVGDCPNVTKSANNWMMPKFVLSFYNVVSIRGFTSVFDAICGSNR